MSPSRDPFGFTANRPPKSTDPIIVVAQPGQELRVIIADDGGVGGGFQSSGDSGRASSPSPSGDSGRASSPLPSGDSGRASSPSGSGDAGAKDVFGFKPFPRGFSPTPITVVAHAGQEIRIVVPDQRGSSGA
jgi:hypothetical protein